MHWSKHHELHCHAVMYNNNNYECLSVHISKHSKGISILNLLHAFNIALANLSLRRCEILANVISYKFSTRPIIIGQSCRP